MNPAKASEEKSKPFLLVKFFTFISLIAIFLGTIVLCFLNIHWARSLQFKKSKDYARLLVENLNHQIYTQFQIPVHYLFGKIQLSNKRQFELMDKIVRNTLHSFKVDAVNLYDVNRNIISYSFEPDLVGITDRGGAEYRNALKGQSTSTLVQTGNFWERLFGLPEEIKVITFAPLREAKPLTPISGEILGVVEIVQDFSEDYEAIFNFQIRVILTCTAVMSVVLAVLIFVVRKGESIIQQRTLERMRLKEQLNRAERLSSLGEMVAAVSHEIRNPLGIIRSSAELLKKKSDKIDPSGAITQVIIEEANRMNAIITDFLAFAKPNTPKLTPCRITDVIEKNISFLRPQIESQGYRIKKQYEDIPPEIMVDPDMMYQVFLNILLNAIQSMPDGGDILVTIDNAPGGVILCFKDSGSGIPKDIASKIWDPFFTTKETGTGLGLGIVKNIIETHNGHIVIENRPDGGGAQATIYLPSNLEDSDGYDFDRR